MHLRTILDEAVAEVVAGMPAAEVLGQPLTDSEWAIVGSRYSASIAAGKANALHHTRDALVAMRQTYRLDGESRRPRRRRSSASPPDEERPRRRTHEEALTAVLADDALTNTADRFGVRAFRQDLLGGRLLLNARVEAWLRHEARTQGRPTIRKDRRGLHVDLLTCAVGQRDKAIDRIATRHGSKLDRLRVIGHALAAFYGWGAADATRWVLTGHPPRLPAVRADVRRRCPWRACSRIVLTIDPTCTPREVTRAYRAVRRDEFGRLRRLTPHRARLAVFAVTHRLLAAPDQMARWNRQAGTRNRYRQLSVFVRDSEHAVQRLTELGLSGGRR